MSKQLKCDHCNEIVPVPADAAYVVFPKGWLTVISRDPVKSDSDADYCSTDCAVAALRASQT